MSCYTMEHEETHRRVGLKVSSFAESLPHNSESESLPPGAVRTRLDEIVSMLNSYTTEYAPAGTRGICARHLR